MPPENEAQILDDLEDKIEKFVIKNTQPILLDE